MKKSSQKLRKPLTAAAVMFCPHYIEFHHFIQRKISGFTKHHLGSQSIFEPIISSVKLKFLFPNTSAFTLNFSLFLLKLYNYAPHQLAFSKCVFQYRL